ncbi:uncharacterized protein [Eurosta solidaginis]|uniref:uncharacterized protein n=1 Tax=Eurosta solidaginis TaxID=178769 RepID=UPI00353084EA
MLRDLNVTINGALSLENAWPPNLQHFDIWNTVETPIDGAAHTREDEPEVLLLQINEGFQYVGKNIDVATLNITYDGDVKDDIDGVVGIKQNRTNLSRKPNDKPNHDAVRSTLEKHLENNTFADIPNERHNRVIHLFPVPVDGECLSDDGRRTGSCFNIYECRAKGGLAKGDCAMGFGVCCIFIADCNTTISNNITYLVSPQFPSFMPSNYSAPCKFKIELMGSEVSQLRIDFYHFSMGQPNRRTGVCDSDVFAVSGGPSGTLPLCGQNSGQHIYYEVGGTAAPRQTLYGNLRPLTFNQLFPNFSSSAMPVIEINMNFTQRFQPIRLWEIRIAQIPFSQRAPVGCLQYHTGTEGIIQTFNFAENGRHLANQNYRICMRQEQNMCSIMYQPCDEQSFRIGPSKGGEQGELNMGAPIMMNPMLAAAMGGTMGAGAGGDGAGIGDSPAMDAITQSSPLANDSDMLQMMDSTTTAMMSSSAVTDATTSTAAETMDSSTIAATTENTAATMSTAAASTTSAPAASTEMSSAAPVTSATSAASSEAPAGSSSATTLSIRSSTTPSTPSSSTLSDEIADEGSGGGDEDWVADGPNRRPGPVRGGFDLFGCLRSAFDFTGERRSERQLLKISQSSKDNGAMSEKGRQLYSRCTDRITMPCIVEDFIGMGPLGSPTLPGCEPVHCGSQFCASGVWPCRIESTVTPFYVGVHFGNGALKGSPEDNIGACLRYQQVECM